MLNSDSPPCPRGGSWRLRREGASSLPSTRSVTRVESTNSEAVTVSVAKIDWLNCTFDTPVLSLHGLVQFLSSCMSCNLSMKLDGGLFGFTERYRLTGLLADGSKVELGAIARGGESQKGRWLLQLTGRGCGLVTDWASLHELLEGLGAALSRTDLAVDFLNGEYTVDDAVDLYESGEFINRGRNPELDIQGAWNLDGNKGRTVYIGKLKNGKSLCVYEKGKQLKDLDSEWTRFEVRLGNRDRVIPLDILTNPDKYFVGAYPALAGLLDSAAEQIPTIHAETKTTLAHLAYHLRRCYGKTIHQTLESTHCSMDELVEEMRVIGMPKRVDPSGPSVGVAWPDLQAQIRSYL
jgi:phage replication initiation protein